MAMSSLGELEQIILLAILRLENQAYGVSIRKEILACTRRDVSPGALYTTLERLERKGMVEASVGSPTPQRGGRAKRFYQVTPAGRGLLIAAQRAYQQMLQDLELLGEHHG